METAAFDQHAAGYGAGPPRQVPGFASLHRMVTMLLAERVPANGRVLVLGAGGGLELDERTIRRRRFIPADLGTNPARSHLTK